MELGGCVVEHWPFGSLCHLKLFSLLHIVELHLLLSPFTFLFFFSFSFSRLFLLYLTAEVLSSCARPSVLSNQSLCTYLSDYWHPPSTAHISHSANTSSSLTTLAPFHPSPLLPLFPTTCADLLSSPPQSLACFLIREPTRRSQFYVDDPVPCPDRRTPNLGSKDDLVCDCGRISLCHRHPHLLHLS